MRYEMRLCDPTKISDQGWHLLQAVVHKSLSEKPFVTTDQAAIAAGLENPKHFASTHRDPNRLLTIPDGAYNPNQYFSKPRMALALLDNQPIGFAYGARNISGAPDTLHLRVKQLARREYFWVRDLYVLPEVKNRRIAENLGRTLLTGVPARLRPSTYVWPDLMPRLADKLHKLGFYETGRDTVHAFGPDSEPVVQARMQTASPRAVLRRLS